MICRQINTIYVSATNDFITKIITSHSMQYEIKLMFQKLVFKEQI